MLDFDELNDVLSVNEKVAMKAKYTEDIKIYCIKQMKVIRELLWVSECFMDYKAQEALKTTINAFYSFAVENGLLQNGEKYLPGKLKACVKLCSEIN